MSNHEKSHFFVQFFYFLSLFFAANNMHFFIFSVISIGILQILNGHMDFCRTSDLEVMFNFVFWLPLVALPPKKHFKVDSHD